MYNNVFNELQEGQIVFFARMLPNHEYYKVLDLKIVSIHEKYCTGTDLKTKQTFAFDKKLAEQVLFLNRNEALAYLNSKKALNKKGEGLT